MKKTMKKKTERKILYKGWQINEKVKYLKWNCYFTRTENLKTCLPHDAFWRKKFPNLVLIKRIYQPYNRAVVSVHTYMSRGKTGRHTQAWQPWLYSPWISESPIFRSFHTMNVAVWWGHFPCSLWNIQFICSGFFFLIIISLLLSIHL